MQLWGSISGTPSKWDLNIPGRRKFGKWKEICRHGKEADDQHFCGIGLRRLRGKRCVEKRKKEKPG